MDRRAGVIIASLGTAALTIGTDITGALTLVIPIESVIGIFVALSLDNETLSKVDA